MSFKIARGIIAALGRNALFEVAQNNLAEYGTEELELAGIDADATAEILGRLPIRLVGNLFEHDPAGVPAYIIAIWSAPPPFEIMSAGWAEDDACTISGLLSSVSDLVAWHPDTPTQWARLYGHEAMLGIPEVDRPTRVWRTPLAWLRAGGEGVCLLTRDAAAELRTLDSIVVEDYAHRVELEELMRRATPRVGIA